MSRSVIVFLLALIVLFCAFAVSAQQQDEKFVGTTEDMENETLQADEQAAHVSMSEANEATVDTLADEPQELEAAEALMADVESNSATDEEDEDM